MSEIRDLLNKITKPVSQFQKNAMICKVRDFGSDSIDNTAGLLYNVEPIDNPQYINKTYKTVENKKAVLTGEMDEFEIETSKNNWVFDVTVNAEPANKELSEGGRFELPQLDSYVVIEWFNDTDAYISLSSSLSAIRIKVNKTIVDVTPDKWHANITASDVEVLFQEIVLLRERKNFISLSKPREEGSYCDTDGGIFITALNDGSNIEINATDDIILRGKAAEHYDSFGNACPVNHKLFSDVSTGSKITLNDSIKLNSGAVNMELGQFIDISTNNPGAIGGNLKDILNNINNSLVLIATVLTAHDVPLSGASAAQISQLIENTTESITESGFLFGK